MVLGSLGRMFVEIGADLSGLKRGIVEAGDSINGLGGTIQKHGVAIGAAMTAVGVSALAMSYKCVDSFKNMNSAMAGVRKTTGMTKEEIAIMKEEFVALSKTIPTSATELAGIGAVAGQLGITGKDNIMEFTKTVAMMGTAFNMSAEDAATAMAKMAAIYDIPIKETGRLGSAINVLGNTTAATEAQIMAYGMNLGAAARQLGFTSTQSLAMGATLIGMGMDASDAGTRLNSAFTAIGKNTKEAAALLGVTEEAFKEAFGKDPMATLQAMIVELGKIQDPLERNTAASDVFGTVGAKSITGLASSLTALETNLKNAQTGFDENMSLTEEYANATDTLAAKLSIAKNKTEAAAISMGAAMAPATIMVADATSGFADIVAGLPGPLQNMAGMAIMAAGGIGSIGGPLMMMVASAPGAITALKGMGLAMSGLNLAFLTSPIGIAIMAIIAALLLLKYAWDNNLGGVQEKVQVFWEALQGFFNWLMEGIGVAIGVAMDWFGKLKDNLALLLGPIGAVIWAFQHWDQIKEIVSKIFNAVLDYIGGLWSRFNEAGGALIQALINGVTGAIGGAVDAVKGALGKIRDLLPFSDAKEGPLADLTESGRKMMETFASGMDGAGNILSSTFAANTPHPAAMSSSFSQPTQAGNIDNSITIQHITLSKDYGFNQMLDDIRAKRMRDGIRFV